ncbi:hypothetical protein Goarm_017347 [Gossypium armourianum]|uniref:Uncharacterized protein n=1 Tax=Gossypium armourianum TaxID=34283 RepID=A0A7J9JFW8_9ROSI|nr:hypothetical protein [Gossypium armourianum]
MGKRPIQEPGVISNCDVGLTSVLPSTIINYISKFVGSSHTVLHGGVLDAGPSSPNKTIQTLGQELSKVNEGGTTWALRLAIKFTSTLMSDKEVLKPDGKIEGAKTRINPTFEGSVGEDVLLTTGVLDSSKHSAMVFKEGADKKLTGSNGRRNNVSKGGGLSFSKDKKLVGNFNAFRRSGKMNNVLKGMESRFKSSGNCRVPLSESMEAVVDLLSSHVAGDTGKEVQVVALPNLDRGSSQRQ